MNSIAKPFARVFTLPHLPVLRIIWTARRRRKATIDLIHASPHLLRDIGAVEDGGILRRR